MSAVVALGIAAVKATLVALFFMHVRYSPRLIGLTVAAGLFWLSILFGLTMNDYLTRGW
jgi:cytochrome c oxidase subunit 4